MKSIGIVYWPKKGSVELNAKRILNEWDDRVADVISLREVDLGKLLEYTYLIFGCSTVGADSWRDAYSGNPWTSFVLKMNHVKTDFKGKKIALFGLGDQILYPDHYVDEMARLAGEIQIHGGVIVGKWPATGYEHTDSKSLQGDFFIGLALDEHNQPEHSLKRIHEWVNDLKKNHFI